MEVQTQTMPVMQHRRHHAYEGIVLSAMHGAALVNATYARFVYYCPSATCPEF